MTRRPWTDAEDAIVRRLYADTSTMEIARQVQRTLASTYQRARHLCLTKSAAYYASVVSGRLQPGAGVRTRFQKGQVPANKGLRRPGWSPGRMKDTQFKPGMRTGIAAVNWRPVGTILSDPEGYLRIKVREARPGERYGFGNLDAWPLLQRHVWRQAHGSIPAGYNVCFKDGDKTNCALGNLELVSRRDLMLRNSVHNYPPAIAKTIQLLGALTRQIRKRDLHASEKQD